ncbi:hypothetical protein K2W90_04410 [Candidatus Babeliales bacterium]|nr:hypothetical protein [Candidatus Babeliales bacterium]
MNISILTVFPELYEAFISSSIIARSVEKGLVSFNLVRFSDLVPPKVRIDSPTCGHGAGMLLKPDVIEKALAVCQEKWGVATVIFFSPQGTKLNQRILEQFAQKHCFDTVTKPTLKQDLDHNSQLPTKPHIILVCARYEGIDARVERAYADYMISVGDYVLMGGDIPAQLFLEGLLRLIPGVVGKQESVEDDSFSGPLLDYPEYTHPIEWHGEKIPDIVTSGNHGAISTWRTEQACKKTVLQRFDWFRQQQPEKKYLTCAKKFIPNHYVAIMHTQIMLKGGMVGQSSVASLDIHDVARTARTYDVENFFIVCPLRDQQQIIGTFLEFWYSDKGQEYNKGRSDAVQRIKPVNELTEVLAFIEEKEGKKPLIITTSARHYDQIPTIDYYSQSEVWQQERPVLLIFGTGQGLAPEVLEQSDYLLLPVQGMCDYNHLSVRSAVSIILDRWLGLQPKLNKLKPAK